MSAGHWAYFVQTYKAQMTVNAGTYQPVSYHTPEYMLFHASQEEYQALSHPNHVVTSYSTLSKI